MAERKAKEIAIDVAFANYLIEERKKQEEKEREKQEIRREKSTFPYHIKNTTTFNYETNQCLSLIINIFLLVLRYGNDLRKMIEESNIKRMKELKEYLQIEDNTNDKTCKIKSLSESILNQSKKTSNKPEFMNNDSR